MSTEVDALAWLDGRTPSAPPVLRQRMETGLARSGRSVPHAKPLAGPAGTDLGVESTVAGALAEAALDRLRLALAAPEDRAAALDLLAADALLTYACEAAAEAGADALADLIRAYDPARLASLIEPA